MASKFGRNVVQPIRDKRDLDNCINYLKKEVKESKDSVTKKLNDRNYTLFITGINIGLRISDLLRLKVKDVKNGYMSVREKKTKKINQIVITSDLTRFLDQYIKRYDLDLEDYLFTSRKGINKHITETQAYRVMQRLAKGVKLNYPIGTHSMRKTFGYHYYKKTNNVVALQKMLNHSDPQTTLIYIGVIQAEVDKERKSFSIGL